MKHDERYAFDRATAAEKKAGRHQYTYSNAVVNFIVEEIAKDPEHIVEKLRRKVEGEER